MELKSTNFVSIITMIQTSAKPISIYLESNPNPNSLKFVVNEMLVPDGMSFDFPTPDSAKDAPLAQELFMYPFVDRVFYMSNFVTVTKREDVEWLEVQSVFRDHIQKFLESVEMKKPETVCQNLEQQPTGNQNGSQSSLLQYNWKQTRNHKDALGNYAGYSSNAYELFTNNTYKFSRTDFQTYTPKYYLEDEEGTYKIKIASKKINGTTTFVVWK